MACGPVTPESSEGRERIARLEGQIEDVERQVERNERVFGPLPLAVERLQWTVDAVNTRLDKRDQTDDERFERLARSFENQITACSSAVSEVADGQRALAEAERMRAKREEERERADDRASDTATQKFIAKYGRVTALSVVLLSALTSLAITFLGGH